ncbi:MAG: transcriptional repressor [Prevotellaceae bacterium]|jgi:Fur family ferric uptake transcriptional regulator/Fur family peroxide stress response transcriptional regulator|nr:transcriptional repressor [Prevotellaceae bacterium]
MNIKVQTIERLQQFGIRPSLQRIAIMHYLMGHLTHPNVDTIYNALHSSVPTLSKTTVYNTLKLFAEQGAILEINIDDRHVRYDADITQHAHFKCKQCGCVHDLPIRDAKFTAKKRINGFRITESQLYYKGYCPNCSS